MKTYHQNEPNLNKQDKMNQNELKLKALEWIRQDIEAQYAKNKDKEAHYKPQTSKALDALRILAFIYGKNLRLEKKTKLNKYEKSGYNKFTEY